MVIGQFRFECRRRVLLSFQGKGHDLIEIGYELRAAGQDLKDQIHFVRGTDEGFERMTIDI
jgi:hypothetical protein